MDTVNGNAAETNKTMGEDSTTNISSKSEFQQALGDLLYSQLSYETIRWPANEEIRRNV